MENISIKDIDYVTKEIKMAILTPCSCGCIYNMKSEFAGKLLLCPRCSSQLRVPFIDKSQTESALQVFDNATYRLRQNHFSISTKYVVSDFDDNEILFVERPAKYIYRIFLLMIVLIFLIVGSTNMVVFVPVLLIAYYFINVKRDITFYDTREKQTVLLEVRQNDWLQKKWIRYTLYDHKGTVLGYFEKNRFTDLLRRKWYFRTPDDTLLLTAQEDSLISSLLRRVTGYFADIAIFRTNFVFYAGDTEQVVGEFNKKIAIFDRYTLDMTMDNDKLIDRRVALALGVLLDTGEGR